MPAPLIVPGEVKYLLEYDYLGRTRTMICPLVNSYSRDDTPSTDMEFTLGKFPIIDHDGIRERFITISGKSGHAFRLGVDAEGNSAFKSGWDLFLDFERFIELYLKRAKDYDHTAGTIDPFRPSKSSAPELGQGEKGAKKKPRLIMRALREQDEYYVEPWAFRPFRDTATSRFTWQYTLTLRAYAKAGERELGPLESFFASAQSYAKTAADVIDQATTYVAYAETVVDQWSATRAAYLEPVRSVGRLMRQVAELGRSVQAAIALPTDLVEATADAANNALDALSEIAETFPASARDRAISDLYELRAQLNDVRIKALQFLGQRRRKISGTRNDRQFKQAFGASGVIQQVSPGIVSYAVSDGETLEDVAVRVAGNSSYTEAIAEINQMQGFSTMPDGSPLSAGVVLLVPTAAGVEQPLTANQSPDEVLGTDALLGDDGDLVVTGGTDVQTVSGPENYLQALEIRLSTVLGEHGAYPDSYGLPRIVGEPRLQETSFRVASAVRSQLLRDPRTERVDAVRVDGSGDRLTITANAVPKSGPRVELSVPVEVS